MYLQASQGEVIELEEEMSVNDLAKKLRTHPSKLTKSVPTIMIMHECIIVCAAF